MRRCGTRRRDRPAGAGSRHRGADSRDSHMYLRDPKLRHQHGTNARNRALCEFDPRSCAKPCFKSTSACLASAAATNSVATWTGGDGLTPGGSAAIGGWTTTRGPMNKISQETIRHAKHFRKVVIWGSASGTLIASSTGSSRPSNILGFRWWCIASCSTTAVVTTEPYERASTCCTAHGRARSEAWSRQTRFLAHRALAFPVDQAASSHAERVDPDRPRPDARELSPAVSPRRSTRP